MTNPVLQNIKARRSVRAYAERQIPADDLNRILEAATYAPSGMNYQTWHFTAVQNPVLLSELNECVKRVFAKSDNPQWKERGHNANYCCYYHAPTLVLVSAKAESPLSPFDCACALQNIFLAATSLGISSCWINQPGQTCDDPEFHAFLTEQLGIPADYRIYGCAALGYASCDAPLKEKKLAAGTVTIL